MPCLSLPAAVAGAVLCGATYVGCLYIFSGKHRRAEGKAPDRNNPLVIRERFARVAVASALTPIISLAATRLPGSAASQCTMSTVPLVRWFGLWAPGTNVLTAAALPLLLTMVLFLGPLVAQWLEGELFVRPHADLTDLQRLRNLVVGPISEEWVFRACMCPLLYGAGVDDAANVFTTAGLFGLAHVHHLFDADHSWTVVAVQFTYTSLFGAYSSYLFLRTGLIVGPVLAHAFCNFQGLPDFGGVQHHPHRRVVGTAYVAGLAGFILLVTLDAIYRPLLFGSLFWRES